MQRVVYDGVTKVFDGGVPVLDDLHLHIAPGEFFGLVGPSGCGKTVALRLLAGLETPTAGRIWVGNRDVTRIETNRRNCGLVTQQNQLIGHLTAAGNIRFPMEVGDERERAAIATERVLREASDFGLEDVLDQRPHRLSGGEQRLVQLARAVIGEPATLLLDEPLASLDSDARRRMRAEIMRVHGDRGFTTVFVTADQTEAMSLCDRIAVLFDGIVHQVGDPLEIYDRPATVRVAGFFGEPAMNVVPAVVSLAGTQRTVSLFDRRFRLPDPALDAYDGRSVLVGFRPEDVTVGGPLDTSVCVRVDTIEPLGHATHFVGSTAAGTALNGVLPGPPPPIGVELDLGLRPERFHVFDALSGDAIVHPRQV
jgi:multiple sugar transport system ATP-binding protein